MCYDGLSDVLLWATTDLHGTFHVSFDLLGNKIVHDVMLTCGDSRQGGNTVFGCQPYVSRSTEILSFEMAPLFLRNIPVKTIAVIPLMPEHCKAIGTSGLC